MNETCRIGNAFCRTSDNQGRCTSCYNGYALNNGNCSVTIISTIASNNCANFTNGICLKCSRGFYMKQGVCTMVSALCNTYDETSGFCTSCYPGYSLFNR